MSIGANSGGPELSVAFEDRRTQGPGPQFGLRSLMWAMAGLSVIFAALSAIDTKGAVFASWFLCLVLAHLAAAAIGTRLRNRTTGEVISTRVEPTRTAVRSQASSPPNGLQAAVPVGRWFLLAAASGAVVGGMFGGLALSFWGRVSLAGLIVGSISSSVVGALLGWLFATFLLVSTKAIRDAARDL